MWRQRNERRGQCCSNDTKCHGQSVSWAKRGASKRGSRGRPAAKPGRSSQFHPSVMQITRFDPLGVFCGRPQPEVRPCPWADHTSASSPAVRSETAAAVARPRQRNIVLLSDGTGNSAAKLHKTNVWWLYQTLDLGDDDQIALYDDGVGTSGFRPLQWLSGAISLGLSRNVRDLYEFLCRHYRPGDHLRLRVQPGRLHRAHHLPAWCASAAFSTRARPYRAFGCSASATKRCS